MTATVAYRLTVKDEAVGVTVRDGAESVFTFDRAGRLFAAWLGERFYRRALSGRIVEKHTVREGPYRIAHRRTLDNPILPQVFPRPDAVGPQSGCQLLRRGFQGNDLLRQSFRGACFRRFSAPGKQPASGSLFFLLAQLLPPLGQLLTDSQHTGT